MFLHILRNQNNFNTLELNNPYSYPKDYDKNENHPLPLKDLCRIAIRKAFIKRAEVEHPEIKDYRKNPVFGQIIAGTVRCVTLRKGNTKVVNILQKNGVIHGIQFVHNGKKYSHHFFCDDDDENRVTFWYGKLCKKKCLCNLPVMKNDKKKQFYEYFGLTEDDDDDDEEIQDPSAPYYIFSGMTNNLDVEEAEPIIPLVTYRSIIQDKIQALKIPPSIKTFLNYGRSFEDRGEYSVHIAGKMHYEVMSGYQQKALSKKEKKKLSKKIK